MLTMFRCCDAHRRFVPIMYYPLVAPSRHIASAEQAANAHFNPFIHVPPTSPSPSFRDVAMKLAGLDLGLSILQTRTATPCHATLLCLGLTHLLYSMSGVSIADLDCNLRTTIWSITALPVVRPRR